MFLPLFHDGLVGTANEGWFDGSVRLGGDILGLGHGVAQNNCRDGLDGLTESLCLKMKELNGLI